MLGFSKVETELIAIESDSDVREAQALLGQAHEKLEKMELKERRYINIMNGTAQQVGSDEFQEAQDQIAVRKGTQTGFFLPAAEEARRGIVPLRQSYDSAVQAAKGRLLEAGTAQLRVLCRELLPVIQDAMQLAAKIQDLRQAVGDCGADLGEHPCPVLLQGGLLAGQLELMKSKGLL